MANSTARVQGLLARDAPLAVLFRRGPSRYVQQILWNTETDEFTPGQWIRGRVYVEKCSLSPDGNHLIYFVLTGRWADETRGSFTAISRPPYYTALALWPEGSTWGGGGYWQSRVQATLATDSKKPAKGEVPEGVHITKGWFDQRQVALQSGWKTDVPTILGVTPFVGKATHFWKQWNGTRLVTQVDNESYVYRHKPIYRIEGKEDAAIENALWADIDQRNRLVYSRHGSIWARQPGGVDRELIDLNANSFEPIEAPDWARRWY